MLILLAVNRFAFVRKFIPLFILVILSVIRVIAASSVAIRDDGDAGFAADLAWSPTANKGYQSDYSQAVGSSKASYSFSVNSGSYRISLTWPVAISPFNKAYSTAVPVTVLQGGKVLLTTTVNMQLAPGDRTDSGVPWKDIGIFNVTANPLEIQIAATPTLYAMADAVRIERTDGTPILSPTLSSVVPASSSPSGRIPITLRGTLFSAGTRVFFGSVASANVTVVSSTEITAIAPPEAAGTVDVKVITPEGLSAVLPGSFKYAVARTLDDGEGGFIASAGAITATQQGFQGDFVYPGGTTGATASWTLPVNPGVAQELAVTWSALAAPYNTTISDSVVFEVRDGSTLLATLSANLQVKPNDFLDLGASWKLLGTYSFPSGRANVVLRNKTSKLLIADAIRVEELVASVPVVTSITPISGPVSGGTTVQISGAGFVPGTTVKFGAVPAASVSVTSASLINAVTPAVTSGGTVSLTVTTPAGNSTTVPNGFTFVTLPTVTVSATDDTAGEPGTGAGAGTFTFTRTGSTSASLTVNFTVSGSASSGTDYTALGNSVTFAAGSSTTLKTVSPLNDSVIEPNESVILSLLTSSAYKVGTPASGTIIIKDDDSAIDFVNSFTWITVRNNYSGWVGMRLHVGATPLSVSSLGRVFRTGNSQNHELRLVSAANGLTVASAIWTPSGGVNNAIKYIPLAGVVILPANTDYYLVSLEVAGGDTWYHCDAKLSTTSAATVISAACSSTGSSWSVTASTNNSYVPVSFQYR
jgi:hypothetical protein